MILTFLVLAGSLHADAKKNFFARLSGHQKIKVPFGGAAHQLLWSPDGKKLALQGSGQESPGHNQVYVYDLEAKSLLQAFPDGFSHPGIFTSDSKWLLNSRRAKKETTLHFYAFPCHGSAKGEKEMETFDLPWPEDEQGKFWWSAAWNGLTHLKNDCTLAKVRIPEKYRPKSAEVQPLEKGYKKTGTAPTGETLLTNSYHESVAFSGDAYWRLSPFRAGPHHEIQRCSMALSIPPFKKIKAIWVEAQEDGPPIKDPVVAYEYNGREQGKVEGIPKGVSIQDALLSPQENLLAWFDDKQDYLYISKVSWSAEIP